MEGHRPKVSVLMPVYNGERFLRAAIDSVLNQTFTDFELVVIDDGSTDGSAAVLASYADPRIRLFRNGKNLGLIGTLNKGIGLMRSEYVARMDCDDVCLPDRFARQVAFLDADPSCALVAVKAVFIDAEGKECGFWSDDRNYTSCAEIAGRLPRANCLVHPGIMIRREVLAGYRYDVRQVSSEDYDLWLRLAADGLKLGKLDETLLKYRLTLGSVTEVSNRRNPDLKNVRTKVLFLRRRLAEGRLNGFALRVFLNTFKDLYYFLGKLAWQGLFGALPAKKA